MGSETTRLTTSTPPDADLVRVLRDVFNDYRSQRHSSSAELDLDRGLWRQLEDLGLALFTTPEEHGGSGGSLVDAAALLGEAAAAAAPVPLVEHDLLASWLLVEAGLPVAANLRTATIPGADGVAHAVLWAGDAASVVALWQEVGADGPWKVADVPASRLTVTPGRDVAGRPSDLVRFDPADLRVGVEVSPGISVRWRLRGALARCAQAVGAMEAVQEIVLSHVSERTQFGRPIGKYQAVQHLVSDVAAEAALARAATDAAVSLAATRGWDDAGLPFAVAVAKSSVGHASSVVVRNAHQLLGAMGTTMEHGLHMLTKPLLVWRSDFGSVHEWDSELTAMASAAGREGLWALVTATADRPEKAHPESVHD